MQGGQEFFPRRSRGRTLQTAVIRRETIWRKRENGELFSVPGRWGLGLGEFGLDAAA